MNHNYRLLTRAALLLALTLVLQSLRLVLPLPPFASTLLIGTLVNACLVVALEKTGFHTAVIIGFSAPVTAYFQQMLPLPIFILPVACANLIYVALLGVGRRWPGGVRFVLAAGGKSLFLYAVFFWLLQQIALPEKLASALLMVMGWPQLLTGLAGAALGTYLSRRLREM